MTRSLIAIIACVVVVHPCAVSIAQSISLPGGDTIQAVDFDRHIQPMLSKLGCNTGSCHGNSAGKGDLKLSLFGYDSQLDFEAITDEDFGRIDRIHPRESMLLQKPTQQVEHGGGSRFAIGSWECELLRTWIENGARRSTSRDALARLELVPAKSVLTEKSPAEVIKVFATFESGDRVDVTPLCGFRVADDTLIELDVSTVRRLRAGDTFVVATYGGWSASAHVAVPNEHGFRPQIAENSNGSDHCNLIDRFVNKKLAELNIDPSPACDDTTFLRRLTLSTTGQLPSVDSIQQFAAETSLHKRADAIERMLADPLHACVWATRMCEITGSRDMGNTAMQSETHHEQKWYTWFEARFARNESYDSLVRQILVATTLDDRSAADFVDNAILANAERRLHDADSYAKKPSFELFWQRSKINEEVEVESLAERVSAAFLGIRIECAKCHMHPFDRWTQDDYRSFANIFTQVRYGMSGDLRVAVADILQQQREPSRPVAERKRVPAIREVYLARSSRDFRTIRDQSVLPPKALGSIPLSSDGDRRLALADWLTDDSNPYFAQNLVNRVWEFYFGRGIVEPVDAFSAANPPTHPELLDALSQEFIKSGYDIRRLERLLLNSAAWQRSAESTSTNRADNRNYARFQVRVLPAFAVADSISCALNEPTKRTASLPTFATVDAALQPYFDVFSRAERRSNCDCERSHDPTLRQAMLLRSDQGLLDRIDITVKERVADVRSDMADSIAQLVDHLFLSVLSRWPSTEEQQAANDHLVNSTSLQQTASEIMWSLINTREFVTLH